MTRMYDVITFDCYGTLIDWNRGIGNAFQSAARTEGITVKSEHVLTIMRSSHRSKPPLMLTYSRPGTRHCRSEMC